MAKVPLPDRGQPLDVTYLYQITATPVNIGTSTVGNDVSAVITSVSTTRVEGIVRFNSSGQVSTSINIFAVGIPA